MSNYFAIFQKIFYNDNNLLFGGDEMKKICGIIAEYNPFHNGHKFQLDITRKKIGADNVVVVLSGNFVQRGEPAIIDKFARTKQALLNGADLVLELPVEFATSSAEGFAQAGVEILVASGIVTDICFGAENTDLSLLLPIAKLLVNETPKFKAILRDELAKGNSFPKARATAVSAILPNTTEILRTPNNILAIEYLKALLRLNSAITPHAIARIGVNHHDKQMRPPYASASAIRGQILSGNISELADYMPSSSYEILSEEYLQSAVNNVDNFSAFFHYIIKTQKHKTIFDVAAQEHYYISDIVSAVKTKNITYTALKRAALNIFLNHEKQEKVRYLRVLGFKRSKSHLITQMYKNAALPIITNTKHAKNTLVNEINATQMYWLALKHKNIPERNEISTPMVILP